MSFHDDDRPRPVPVHVVGQDLSDLSVEDLGERLDMLKAEIARLEAVRAAKLASRDVASGFFKPRSAADS